jgi:hypothetical protein
MYRKARTTLFVLCTAVAWTNPAAADVITDWNERTLPVVAAAAPAGRGATPAVFIDIAMVHAAMYDAVQAYDKRFEPYAGAIPGASGSSIVAAAKAARDVLVARFPMQAAAISTTYNNYLTSLVPAPSAADIAGGEAIGAMAASNLLTFRAGDGSFPATFPQFTGGTGPGEWRPNPGTPGMVSPWAGGVRPFTLESLDRCRAEAPPALTSAEYAEAYNEVKSLGSATSTTRSAEQGQIARMYSSNFTALLSRLLRDIANTHLAGADVASLGNRARMFALTIMAVSDAFICAWDTKTHYNFWRPSHAIQNGDQDDNLLTEKDASWTPYLGNPNYPDYTSGANNVTGAATRMLQLFFGSDRPFDIPVFAASPAIPFLPTDPNPRMYDKFSDISKDVVDARIYLGIHFRFADTEARSQGRRVANYAFKNILQPLDKHENK